MTIFVKYRAATIDTQRREYMRMSSLLFNSEFLKVAAEFLSLANIEITPCRPTPCKGITEVVRKDCLFFYPEKSDTFVEILIIRFLEQLPSWGEKQQREVIHKGCLFFV